MQVSNPTGRPQLVILARRILLILALTQLGACIEAAPVPDWVLVCHDTSGGAQCPPSDTGADSVDAPEPELGPSDASDARDDVVESIAED
jgi:hypothetical protein